MLASIAMVRLALLVSLLALGCSQDRVYFPEAVPRDIAPADEVGAADVAPVGAHDAGGMQECIGGAYLRGRCVKEKTCRNGWCLIPKGSFTMGSPKTEPCRLAWETAHPVTLTRSFWIGQTEVTQAQWSAHIPTNPSSHQPCDSCPVDKVSFSSVLEYANRLSEAEGYSACYTLTGCITSPWDHLVCAGVSFAGLDCPGYRLPTEAEWEYAARAGTSTPYWNGTNDPSACAGYDAMLDTVGWCKRHPKETLATQPVGLLLPNPWGLYDVHGNVWEWTWDSADISVDYSLPAPPDPVGTLGAYRVTRGGSFGADVRFCRSAVRLGNTIDNPHADPGFRLVRSVVP